MEKTGPLSSLHNTFSHLMEVVKFMDFDRKFVTHDGQVKGRGSML